MVDVQEPRSEATQLLEVAPSPAGVYKSKHETQVGSQYETRQIATVIAHPDDIARVLKGFRGDTEIQTDMQEFTDKEEIIAQGTPVAESFKVIDGKKRRSVNLAGQGFLRFKPETWHSTWGSAVSGESGRDLFVETKGTKRVFVEEEAFSHSSLVPRTAEVPPIKETFIIRE
ncbi:MAG TPA: hypothetical protein VMW29_01630 [Candidatus Bathyarchaeia archaeon]|nr:hypothetical protein [Candidatus Bathyarchaeia archaeon]